MQPNREPLAHEYTTNQLRPETLIQALMTTGPQDTALPPIEELAELHDIIAYATELLTDEQTYILNAIVYERISLEDLAARFTFSKTQAWRLYHRTIARLGRLLIDHKPIRERLGMPPTWNSEAMNELVTIAGSPFDDPIEATINVEGAVFAIDNHVTAAVAQFQEGLEWNAVKCMTAAAEHAVMYLRSVGQWSLIDMHDLLVSKQMDYGHGNILKFGMEGVMVRASDKCERLKNLTKRGVRPRNESLLDSFRDIIGYAVIARMLKAETFELELADPDDHMFFYIEGMDDIDDMEEAA